MNLKEVITAFEELRRKHGDEVPVVVYDGSDPAELGEVQTIEAGARYFFNLTEGFSGKQFCVCLLP